MTYRASLVALWCVVSLGASGRGQEVEPSAAVLSLETQRLGAMVEADTSFLIQVFADDLTYGHSNGVVHSKSELIALLGSGDLDYRRIEAEGITVRVYEGSAVVTGSAAIVVVAGERTVEITILYTGVYVREDTAWRMVAYQSTRRGE